MSNKQVVLFAAMSGYAVQEENVLKVSIDLNESLEPILNHFLLKHGSFDHVNVNVYVDSERVKVMDYKQVDGEIKLVNEFNLSHDDEY